MNHPYATFAVVVIAAFVGSHRDSVVSAQAATKAYALPAAATEPTSFVSNVPDSMLSLNEGGSVPSEPAATCDNRTDGNSPSGVGVGLQHYYPAAKGMFDQIVGVLRQYGGVAKEAQIEAGSAAVVSETLRGAEAAYYFETRECIQDAHPTATRILYRARLIQATTLVDISVKMHAKNPDAARKYATEMMQKIAALNYTAVK